MSKKIMYMALAILLISSCTTAWRSFHAITGVKKITKDELKVQLHDPDLTIIDVRDTKDWESSSLKIPGAIRENPYDVRSWSKKYDKRQRIVLYCA
ncbi:MAG: hypothetical protein JSV21_03555 [Nitrospirota bacterium]|nr:MAG: hypothetical protein JSV21_03555 [Nitrospirota bacterium]